MCKGNHPSSVKWSTTSQKDLRKKSLFDDQITRCAECCSQNVATHRKCCHFQQHFELIFKSVVFNEVFILTAPQTKTWKKCGNTVPTRARPTTSLATACQHKIFTCTFHRRRFYAAVNLVLRLTKNRAIPASLFKSPSLCICSFPSPSKRGLVTSVEQINRERRHQVAHARWRGTNNQKGRDVLVSKRSWRFNRIYL